MQTFLPHPDFVLSARRLDNKRLGKQITEAMQIHWALVDDIETSGWRHHPAVKMWTGYEGALVRYGQATYAEWQRRYVQGLRGGQMEHKAGEYFVAQIGQGENPPWLGDEVFHAAHRSNLLRKAPEFYGRFGWTEPDDLPYVWPVV
jgi:hypothetical protein